MKNRVRVPVCQLAAFAIVLAGCVGPKPDQEQTDRPPAPEAAEPTTDERRDTTVEYRNEKWAVLLEHPPSWTATATSEDAPLQAINVYRDEALRSAALPLTIHAPAGISHVSVYPLGWGTEFPPGAMRELGTADDPPAVSFAVNSKESTVLELASGEAWGWFLRPSEPPASWSPAAFLFAQVAVDELEMRCFDRESGEPKGPDACDPLFGDRVERHGTLDPAERALVVEVLESIRFESGSL